VTDRFFSVLFFYPSYFLHTGYYIQSLDYIQTQFIIFLCVLGGRRKEYFMGILHHIRRHVMSGYLIPNDINSLIFLHSEFTNISLNGFTFIVEHWKSLYWRVAIFLILAFLLYSSARILLNYPSLYASTMHKLNSG
jgi:hypothetical protein